MSVKYECRICYDEEKNKNKLIRPCACDGTNRYVHRKCLDKWRHFVQDMPVRKRCSECKQKYIIESMYPNEEYKLRFLSINRNIANEIVLVNICLIVFGLGFNIIDNHYHNICIRSFLNNQNVVFFNEHFDGSGVDHVVLYMLYMSYVTFIITYFSHFIFAGLIYFNIQRRVKYFLLTFFSHLLKIGFSSHFLFSIHLAKAFDSEILIIFTSFLNLMNVFIFSSIFENHNKTLKLLNTTFNKKTIKNLEKRISV